MFANKTYKTKNQSLLAASPMAKRSRASVFQLKDNRSKVGVTKKGIYINDNRDLETEADIMGNKALNFNNEQIGKSEGISNVKKQTGSSKVLQAKWWYNTKLKQFTWLNDGQDILLRSEGDIKKLFNDEYKFIDKSKVFFGVTEENGWLELSINHKKATKKEKEKSLKRSTEYDASSLSRREGSLKKISRQSSLELIKTSEDKEHTSNDFYWWQTAYEEYTHGSTWISSIEKIKDLLDLELENVEAQEENDVVDDQLMKKKAFIEREIKNINAKERQLTHDSIKIVRSLGTYGQREETSAIQEKIEKERMWLNNFLNDLYGMFNIPTDDPGGSRSPRKFGDAKGVLIFYGNLPNDFEEATVAKMQVSKGDFEKWKEDEGQYYGTSYDGESNIIYFPKQDELPSGKLRHKRKSLSFFEAKSNREFYIKAVREVDQLSAPKREQHEIYTGNARRKDRGKGQFKAMDDTNAAAYAFGIGLINALQTNWEWLHIRGAGLGGDTNSTNLIAGTYSANSHMIPYENQIKTMSAYANSKQPLYVNWRLVPGPHKFTGHQIKITLYAPNGLFDKKNQKKIKKIPQSNAWVVSFNPLKAVVYDKFLRGAAWLRFKSHTGNK